MKWFRSDIDAFIKCNTTYFQNVFSVNGWMCYATVVAAAATAVIDDNSAWAICLHLHVKLKLMYLFTEKRGKNLFTHASRVCTIREYERKVRKLIGILRTYSFIERQNDTVASYYVGQRVSVELVVHTDCVHPACNTFCNFITFCREKTYCTSTSGMMYQTHARLHICTHIHSHTHTYVQANVR